MPAKKVVDESIARRLWDKYSKKEIKGIDLIPVGFKNNSYLIEIDSGKKFVLKVYAQDFLSDEIIENDAKIANFLKKNNLPVVDFIPGFDKRYVQAIECEGKRYQSSCSIFSEAGFFKSDSLNKQKVRSLARLLGNLHDLLGKYRLKGEMRKLTPVETLEGMMSGKAIKKSMSILKGIGITSPMLTIL